MQKRPVGRPKKEDSVRPLTKEDQKKEDKRKYMRKYQSEIKAGISQLEKDEKNCLDELDKIRKERTKLINELEKANIQAEGILKEKVKN